MRRLLILVVAAACKQHEPAPAIEASATATASASAVPVAAVPARGEYAGTYTATPGALFVPDAAAWEGFKFRGEDASAALGAGTLSFTVEADGGALSGEMTPPLGPATLSGVVSGGSLSFHVTPAQASELRFSGTGTGSLDGGSAAGEIHVSSWHGNVLREATFQVSSPPAQPQPK